MQSHSSHNIILVSCPWLQVQKSKKSKAKGVKRKVGFAFLRANPTCPYVIDRFK
jgi:hypothetical protein